MFKTITRIKTLSKTSLILGLSLISMGGAPAVWGAAKAKAPLNFVFFFADDLSRHDIGIYGNPAVKTPHIDQLASEGMLFTKAGTTASTCAPSRATLLTGQYPVKNGLFSNHGKLNAQAPRLPKLFGEHGYNVFLHGKRHFGTESEDMGFENIPLQRWVDGRTYLLDFGNVEKALQRSKQENKPFVLYVASGNPHAPHPTQTDVKADDIVVPPNKIDTPRFRKAYTHYYKDIENTDDELGACYQTLKKLELEDNTVFIFSSDHGNTMFAKWTCYEEGIAVPLIARWPNTIKAGSRSEAMVNLIDIFPTFMDLAGVAQPKNIDGQSIKAVLTAEKNQHRKYLFGLHNSRGIVRNFPWLKRKKPNYSYPIRSVRDERYKLIRNLNFNETFHCWMTGSKNAQTDRSDLEQFVGSWRDAGRSNPEIQKRVNLLQKRPAIEFYDLQNDPYELNNLAKDPKMGDHIARLDAELKAWMNEQGDEGIKTDQSVPWK